MWQQGETITSLPLEFRTTSTFAGEFALANLELNPGYFDLVLVADRPDEGNTGTDRMTVLLRR